MHYPCSISEIQRTSSSCGFFTDDGAIRVFDIFERQYKSLIENSISKNSWKVYESAVASFENFRLYCNLSNIWPVPLTDIVNFIAYLEKMNYEVSTAKSYISGLSFKMKVITIQNTTKSFVITKMLSGMERMHKRVNARKPITFEILEKIINVLLHVCNSYYEATLFAACFSVVFWGFLRVGEFALSQNSETHVKNLRYFVRFWRRNSYFEYPLFKNRSVG